MVLVEVGHVSRMSRRWVRISPRPPTASGWAEIEIASSVTARYGTLLPVALLPSVASPSAAAPELQVVRLSMPSDQALFATFCRLRTAEVVRRVGAERAMFCPAMALKSDGFAFCRSRKKKPMTVAAGGGFAAFGFGGVEQHGFRGLDPSP